MSDSSTEELLVALGREIRAMRIKRGKSRDELAELAETTARQVGKIERGERGQLHEVWRIAQALEVSLSWLIAEAEVADKDDAAGGATVVHTIDGETYLMPRGAHLGWSFSGGDSPARFNPTPRIVSEPERMVADEDGDIEAEQEGHHST